MLTQVLTPLEAPNSVVIRGSGMALPPLAFTNEDICHWHGRRDPSWIYETFGVRTRHAVYDYRRDRLDEIDEDDLAFQASQAALRDAGLKIHDIQVILLVTFTPTHVSAPDPACTLHKRLGASERVSAFTHLSGCTGPLNAMMMGTAMIRGGQARNVLICCASSMSAFCRPEKKDKLWLHASIFGDGAAALVLSGERSQQPRGFSFFHMGADQDREVARRKFGGSKHMPTPDNIAELMEDHVAFDFRRVPKNLQEKFTSLYREIPDAGGLPAQELDWVLFNMSNAQIQRRWLRSMEIPEEKSFFNMEQQGNCAAASLALVMHDFLHTGRARSGDVALILGIGTGLQFGGVLYHFP